MEGLYFRLDKPQQCKINVCNQDECWQPTKNNQNYCDVHQKMHQDNSLKVFTKLLKNIGNKWADFINELKANSDEDDQSQIYYEDFVRILIKYKADISEKEMQAISMAFPGK